MVMSVYELGKAAENYRKCDPKLRYTYIGKFMTEVTNTFLDQRQWILKLESKIEELEKRGGK